MKKTAIMIVGDKMKECPRCHQSHRYFYTFNGITYCRSCLPFKRIDVNAYKVKEEKEVYGKEGYYQLDYDLTLLQKKISDQTLQSLKLNKDVFIQAVCGAGKTEIVYESILYYLKHGKRIGFALPRRELVKEIYQRLVHQFHNVTISLVYGGHSDDLDGQLVVLTTHQLYRYPLSFDLLIVDEIDAFPYKNNLVLQSMVKNACRGNRIMMSATLEKSQIEANASFLSLNRRYHTYDLPVPECIIAPKIMLCGFLLKKLFYFKKQKQPVLLFVPTFFLIHKVSIFLKLFPFRFAKATSLEKDNQETLRKLKNKELDVIVTTSILERGVTIEDVQVIVWLCDHSLYDRATLIQIAGRVGRSKNAPEGKVYFLAKTKTKEMKACVETIRTLNNDSV